MKKSVLLLGIVSVLTMNATAQNDEKEGKFGLETDILWPFVAQATRTHFTIKLWQKGNLRGDVYVGVNIDFPRDRETEGRFADYSLAKESTSISPEIVKQKVASPITALQADTDNTFGKGFIWNFLRQPDWAFWKIT